MARPPKNGKLIYREDFNPTLAIFRFALDGGVPEFQAGQFVTLGLPIPSDGGKVLWRAYSIASPPELKDYVELYIRWATKPVPGRFTTELWKMKVGDPIQWRDPTGAFTIEQKKPDGSPDMRRLVMVGGGTGLAPFVACALHLKHAGFRREIVVCHGASYIDELGYRDLLLDLEKQSVGDGRKSWNFRYLASISRPKEEANKGWTGFGGRVETLVQGPDGTLSPAEKAVGERFTPENTFFHICGYDGTIKAVLGAVEPRGFVTRQARRADGSYDIKFESYG